MKRALVSSISFALALGQAGSALAYAVPSDWVRSSARVIEQNTREGYDRPTRRDLRENLYFNDVDDRDRNLLREIKDNQLRPTAVSETNGLTNLLRGRLDRRFRRLSRSAKPGTDSYRMLNVPNTRYLRQKVEEESSLPPSLVQTGGTWSYDRPTRRDIRENLYFNDVNDRDRDVLGEIEAHQR